MSSNLKHADPDQTPDLPALVQFERRELLLVAEIAHTLRVSPQHVIDLIEEGWLQGINIGGKNCSARKFWRVPLINFERYLRANHSLSVSDEQ